MRWPSAEHWKGRRAAHHPELAQHQGPFPAARPWHVGQHPVDVHAAAAGAQLITFHCPVCGYLLRAEKRHPSSAPMCAGSKARIGKQHQPAQMNALFIR
jgi:rubrerythrin